MSFALSVSTRRKMGFFGALFGGLLVVSMMLTAFSAATGLKPKALRSIQVEERVSAVDVRAEVAVGIPAATLVLMKPRDGQTKGGVWAITNTYPRPDVFLALRGPWGEMRAIGQANAADVEHIARPRTPRWNELSEQYLGEYLKK